VSEFSEAYVSFLEADLVYWRVLVEELGETGALLYMNNIAAHTMLSATLRDDYRQAYNRMIEVYERVRFSK